MRKTISHRRFMEPSARTTASTVIAAMASFNHPTSSTNLVPVTQLSGLSASSHDSFTPFSITVLQ
jgi:hypothetical protein